MSLRISRLSCEHYPVPLGIRHTRPRLSWRFEGDIKDWVQTSYEYVIRYNGGKEAERYDVTSSDSLLVPWPGRDLHSRDAVEVQVRAKGNGRETEWAELNIEVALLDSSDWTAKLLGGPEQSQEEPHRPILLRKAWRQERKHAGKDRLYVTAHGCYKVYINGVQIGDHALAPGWQSYHHRLHYQTYNVGELLRAHGEENVIGVVLGEGWFATRLNFGGGRRNIWGSDLGVLLQLETDGEVQVSSGDVNGWEWAFGPIVKSEIYDGEEYDGGMERPGWMTKRDSAEGWQRDVRGLGFPRGRLIAAECPPVRKTQEIRPQQIITTSSGKTVLDFGQNLVGWLKLESHPQGVRKGDIVEIRHAEVMEEGELGVRPLRHARAGVKLTVGSESLQGYEPSFTCFGFRYAQVEGWKGISVEDVTAQVVHTDMERTGWFECDHPLINRLWENVNWGLRGNFVSVPTDCPQRDERLGWTGDLQVFAETASFLFDTSSTIGGWLQDLAAEQIKDWEGVVPLVVPNTLGTLFGPPPPSAIWGDVAVLTPKDLYTASGDVDIVAQQYDSMTTWLNKGIKRNAKGLWDQKLPQFGDWLDPKAPSDAPQDGRTDNLLVADAWLVHTTEVVSKMAELVGDEAGARQFADDASRLKSEYQREYITQNGRLMSDTQTALALALHFHLLPEAVVGVARDRLDHLVRKAIFQISTGFAGTPIILHALSDNQLLQHAYRMFQEKQFPSILYPVSMGATTIVSVRSPHAEAPSEADGRPWGSFAQWERWDSMLPDGTINPGEMTRCVRIEPSA